MEGARVRSAWQAERLAGKLWMEAFGGKPGAVNHLKARQAALKDLGARPYCNVMLHASGLLSPGSFTMQFGCLDCALAAFPEARADKQLGSSSW